jgi:hypothetical protein
MDGILADGFTLLAAAGYGKFIETIAVKFKKAVRYQASAKRSVRVFSFPAVTRYVALPKGKYKKGNPESPRPDQSEGFLICTPKT